MPYDLPDIRLTPDVMRRVQGRLLGIFGGVRAKGLDPNPPRVIRRHRDPIFGPSKGVVRRRLRMKPTKIRIPSGMRRDVEGAAKEENDDQEVEEIEGQQQEQEQEGEQEEEEQYEEMYVEEEEEGDDAHISGKLSSIEKLEIQKEILRNLLAYKKGEKGENSESENESDNENEDEEDDLIEDERILKKRRRHFLRNRVRLRIDDNNNKNDIKNERIEGIEEVEGNDIPKKKWRTRSLNEIVHDKRAKMMAIYQKKLSNLTRKKEKEKEKEEKKKKRKRN